MKDELQGKLFEILTSIQTAAGKASDFAMEQIPDVAMQYVAYGRVVQSVYLASGLVATIFGAILLARGVKKEDADLFGFGLLAGGAGLLGVFYNFSAFAMVWFAPKIWLLKEIAEMLK